MFGSISAIFLLTLCETLVIFATRHNADYFSDEPDFNLRY